MDKLIQFAELDEKRWQELTSEVKRLYDIFHIAPALTVEEARSQREQFFNSLFHGKVKA